MEHLIITDPFESLAHHRDTKHPIDLSHHLNDTARRRKPSPLKELARYMGAPGMKSLAGGMPFPEYFPFNSVEVEFQTPNSLGKKTQSTRTFDVHKYGSDDSSGIDLAHLLQYSAVEGHPFLLKCIKDLIRIGFEPGSEWDTLLTCGSTDGLSKILAILVRQGDRILVEKFTYVSFITAAAALGADPLAVEIDDQGMSPKDLRRVLQKCKREGGIMPRLVYLVTVGQNPTGTVMGIQRKKDIMAIAEEYDLLIIEDDPYFFLQFEAPKLGDHDDHEAFEFVESRDVTGAQYCREYMQTLIPSFLKFDAEGRVFRVETFSKVIAPGLRLGSITTSPVFYDALLLLSQSTTQAPSGLAMAFAAKLLFEHGLKGWCQWTAGLRMQYQQRRDHMVSLLKREFGGENPLASWQVPDGGMFIWFKLNLSLLPARHTNSHDSTKAIMLKMWIKLAESKVLIVPGWTFAATPAIAEWKTNFYRLTYASSTIEDMDDGVTIMGTVIRAFFAETDEDEDD